MNLLQYLERLHDSSSIDAVWNNHIEEMARFGFHRCLYGFTRTRTARSFGDQQDHLMLTNHCESYIRDYLDSGMYNSAPMVAWAANNVGPCSWGEILGRPDSLSENEKKIVAFNHSYEIVAGYSISFKDISSRSKGAIGLTAQPGMSQKDVEDVWAEHGRIVVQMNNAVHLKLTSLPYSSRRRPLTARQREVLEWVGDGKTMQDIALIMGLKSATVEKHLRLAREALDVDTTAQAVLKASRHNQIFSVGS